MQKNYKEYYLLLILLLTSFVSVYFMSHMLNRLIFLSILVTAFRTRYDYVYLVWFFMINDAPGRLFSAGTFDAARIPLYPVASGISISFEELFLILYLFKYISLKKTPEFIFKKEFLSFLHYGLFVVAYSFLLGLSFDNIVRTFRIFLPWSLIFILPTYIYNREILVRCSLMVFPTVFLTFSSQVYSYYTGNYLDSYIRGVDSHFFVSDEASRAYSAVYLTLFAIIQALYYLFSHKSAINKNYLGIVLFIGIFTIFLTATRGWIMAMTVLVAGSFIIFGFSGDISKWVRIVSLSAIIIWIVGSHSPIIQKQVDATFHRLSTLEALAAGDTTAGGTLKRLDFRIPRVMSQVWESPFVGWGFSNHYFAYEDRHVGHHNILLNIGIAGYVFVNGLFVYLCLKIWTLTRNNLNRKYEGNAPLIFVVGLLAVMVIHSTSTQLWGYTLDTQKIPFLGFLFVSINVVLLNERKKEDKC